jgi:prevent-host-death family protein
MKQRIAASEFKAKCLHLLDEVQQTRREIVITKRGRAVARLLPVEEDIPSAFGRMKGTGRILGDIVAPTGEIRSVDDVKSTGSGRKVYGGGVTPGEEYPPQHANAFQRRILYQGSGPAQNVFRHFAASYFGVKKPALLSESWTPDADTMNRFKEYLRSKQVTFTDEEFAANQDWIRDGIRHEFLFRAFNFNRKVDNQAANQTDPEVLAATTDMPKAESLLKSANRAYAMRPSAK